MAVDAENRWKKMDSTTGKIEIGVGTELVIPAALGPAAKSAALAGYPQWHAWMVGNLEPGTMKTWHTETAPEWYKQAIWQAARI